MKCCLCHTEHAERCKHCLNAPVSGKDSTMLNCYGYCRACQRLFDLPRVWRRTEGGRVVGYGCYFPSTDLNVNEYGARGTGAPRDVEWVQPSGENPN